MEKSKNTSIRATNAAALSQWAWVSRSEMKNIYTEKKKRNARNRTQEKWLKYEIPFHECFLVFYAFFLPSHRSGAFLCVRSVRGCHSTPANASAREGSVGKSHQSIMLLTLDILMHIIRHTYSHVFLRWWQAGHTGYVHREWAACVSRVLYNTELRPHRGFWHNSVSTHHYGACTHTHCMNPSSTCSMPSAICL